MTPCALVCSSNSSKESAASILRVQSGAVYSEDRIFRNFVAFQTAACDSSHVGQNIRIIFTEILRVLSAVFYNHHIEQSQIVCRRADGSQEQKHNSLLLTDEENFFFRQ